MGYLKTAGNNTSLWIDDLPEADSRMWIVDLPGADTLPRQSRNKQAGRQ
ncbi:hypothetical protein [Bacilliculturomica massiliensis]|nr:hypothetical protein [Bacilliculturomica massiliensis]